MPEPLGLTITFAATGEAVIQRAASSVDRLASSINNLSVVSRRNAAAMAEANRYISQFATEVSGKFNTAVSYMQSGLNGVFNTLTRIARYGFYALVGQFTALSFSLRALGKSFLEVNEFFKGLEITLKSSFNSLGIAIKLREELMKISTTSPLTLKETGSALRSLSVIPYTRAQIGSEASQNKFDTVNTAISLVEKMRIFRPDKNVEEAIFAIREALTGQFRSIIRRFDIPSSSLALASGKTMKELQTDPEETLKAMSKFFGGVIQQGAVSDFRRQPSVLFEKLKKEVAQIPLLMIGDSGLYDKVTGTIGEFFNRISNFVLHDLAPYTTRIGNALSGAFDILNKASGSFVEKFLGKFNLSETQRPDLTQFQRIAELATSQIEAFVKNLPSLAQKVGDFINKLIPALELLTKVGFFVLNSFVNHPVLTTLGFALKDTISRAVGDGLKLVGRDFSTAFAANFVRSMQAQMPALRMAAVQAAVASGAAFISPTGSLRNTATGRIMSAASLPVTPGLGSRLTAGAAGLVGGAVAVGAELLTFGAAVAVFAAGAYAIERGAKWFSDRDKDRREAVAKDFTSNFPMRSLAQTGMQLTSDSEILSRKARENALAGGPLEPTIDTGSFGVSSTKTLTEFAKNYNNILRDIGGLNDLLSKKDGEYTLLTTGEFFKSGDALRVGGKLHTLASGAQDMQSVYNENKRASLSSKYGVELPTKFDDSQQSTLEEINSAIAKETDRFRLFAGPFAKSLGKLNDSLNVSRLGEELTGHLDQFREQLRDEFNPAAKESGLIGKLGNFVTAVSAIGVQIDKAISDPQLVTDSEKAAASVQVTIDEIKGKISRDPVLQRYLGKQLAELESFQKSLEAPFSFAEGKITEFRANISQAMSEGISGSVEVYVKNLLTTISAIHGAGSAGEGGRMAGAFSSYNTGLSQLLGVNGGELTHLLSGQARSPFADGYKATTQAQLGSARDLAKLFEYITPQYVGDVNNRLGNYSRSRGTPFSAISNSSGLSNVLSGFPAEGKEIFAKDLETLKLLEDEWKKFQDRYKEFSDQVRGRGVFVSLLDGFTDMTEQWKETAANFKQVGVDLATSLKTELGSAFTDFITGSKSAGEAFQQFGINLFKTATQIMTNKAIEQILGVIFSAVGSGLGSYSGRGVTSSMFAQGAAVLNGHAEGGPIFGGSGVRDDVPALLMGGEYVIPKNIVQKYGTGYFDGILSGMKHYAIGGYVGDIPNMAQMSGNMYNIHIEVNGGAATTNTSGSSTDKQSGEALAKTLKAVVLQVLDDQSRNGGRLRK